MNLRQPLSLLPALLATACVTINIYFPAAAAEKAADRIIEEVWGKEPAAAPPVEKEQSRHAPGWLDWLVSPAHAAEADLNVSSPAIDRLTASMRTRHAKLEPFYASGAVGLTGDGQVAVRDAAAIGLRDRNRVKKLVADENADRNALYKEIARVNGQPKWEAQIRTTFARRWVDNAPAGWWFKGGGGWQQKR
jgi:uncharacterized protein YdbL (DUF1318 family)